MDAMIWQNRVRLIGLKRKRGSARRSQGADVEEGKNGKTSTEGKQATRAFKPEQLDGRIISPGERRKCEMMTPTLVYVLN